MSLHIKYVLQDGELAEVATVKDYLIVQTEDIPESEKAERRFTNKSKTK